jgi:hypothetical protein
MPQTTIITENQTRNKKPLQKKHPTAVLLSD